MNSSNLITRLIRRTGLELSGSPRYSATPRRRNPRAHRFVSTRAPNVRKEPYFQMDPLNTVGTPHIAATSRGSRTHSDGARQYNLTHQITAPTAPTTMNITIAIGPAAGHDRPLGTARACTHQYPPHNTARLPSRRPTTRPGHLHHRTSTDVISLSMTGPRPGAYNPHRCFVPPTTLRPPDPSLPSTLPPPPPAGKADQQDGWRAPKWPLLPAKFEMTPESSARETSRHPGRATDVGGRGSRC